MGNPMMKLVCSNPSNPLYNQTALGHVRPLALGKGTDLVFCVQLDDTSHALSRGWHVQNRQDWRNLDAKRPQTKDKRRPTRGPHDNMENERQPT